MFAAASSLTTTTISSSSLGGYRGKEVVQKSRSSMRSTARRNNVNVVVRAEAQKTIDMNEVSFTLRLILLFLSICCFPFWDGNNGSFFFFVFFWIHRPSSADGTKDIVVKMDKISDIRRDYFL